MRRASLLSVLAVLLFALAVFVPAAARARPRAVEQRDTSLEQGILREVNRVRETRGLPTLTLSAPLQAAATYQSRDMIERGYFDHQRANGAAFADRLRRFYPLLPGGLWTVGENLAWGAPTITPAATVTGWLNSPPHRRILFGTAWRDVGVSAFSSVSAGGVFASVDGPVYVVTMDFGKRGSGR